MALSGKLSADFSEFDAAVRKSEAELKGFEVAAGRVGTSLQRMATPTAFSQVATLAQQTTTGFTALSTVATTTSGSIGKLYTGLAQTDRILASMGVNLGPQVS